MTGSLPAIIGEWRELQNCKWSVQSSDYAYPEFTTYSHLLSHVMSPIKVGIEGNLFTGALPAPSIGNWVNLKFFFAGIEGAGNNMSGSLPSEIGNWVNLQVSNQVIAE